MNQNLFASSVASAVFILGLVVGCTVKTSDPEPTKASSGDTAKGKGSGTGTPSGSSTGTPSGSGTAMPLPAELEHCGALCDAQAKATGCAKAPDAASCKDLCAQLIASFTPDFVRDPATCQPKADDYYQCASKQTWKCEDGSDVPTADAACDDKQAAFTAACAKK
jgi:hypothetical protein